MIRSNTASKSNAPEPVYRHVLHQAWHFAWREKRFWPLSFFASILLTAGTYNIFGDSYFQVLRQNEIISGTFTPWAASRSWDNIGDLTGVLSAFEWLIAGCLIILAILAFSCIAQGALVYCLGAARRGEKSEFKKALGVGAKAFWPIATLNVLVLLAFAISKFLIAAFLNIALNDGSLLTSALYVAVFVLLMAFAFIVTIIQIFALNAMILQGASVADAIMRGLTLFKRHWVVSVETAMILAIISIAFNLLLTYLLFIGAIPFVLAIITASVMQSPVLFWCTLGLAGLGLLAFFLGSVAFLSQLQYATWTFLYRRLGEGGVLPKLHRLARSVFGKYTVPND